MQELLQLPLQVQATLVAGYLGYALFKRDHRETEKTTDMWLLILLFGLPTAIIVQLYDSMFAYISVLSGPIIALGWLKFGARCWTSWLHQESISHRINDGDVWKTLSSDKNVIATQVKLYHENGNCYCCFDTSKFDGKPFAPFIMDMDGIAFYVTHTFDKAKDKWLPSKDVTYENGNGDMITYFPRADIKRLEMRYKRPNKTKVLASQVVALADEEVQPNVLDQ